MATRTAGTQATTVKYASRSAVYGSNAYDLSRARTAAPVPSEIERTPAGRPEIRPAAQPAPKNAPKSTPKTETKAAPKTAAKTARKVQYGISLYAAAGFIVVAVLMVFVLLAHVRLAEVVNETAKLQTQLNQLNEDERKLQIAYGNAFDVNQVEQYATQKLGMSKPRESQVGTISASEKDKAIVADTRDDAPANENMATFLASLLAYFK